MSYIDPWKKILNPQGQPLQPPPQHWLQPPQQRLLQLPQPQPLQQQQAQIGRMNTSFSSIEIILDSYTRANKVIPQEIKTLIRDKCTSLLQKVNTNKNIPGFKNDTFLNGENGIIRLSKNEQDEENAQIRMNYPTRSDYNYALQYAMLYPNKAPLVVPLDSENMNRIWPLNVSEKTAKRVRTGGSSKQRKQSNQRKTRRRLN